MAKKMTMGDAEKELIKYLGEDTVFLDGDVSIGRYEVISTGSQSLDYCIGVGGVPRGRINSSQEKKALERQCLHCRV